MVNFKIEKKMGDVFLSLSRLDDQVQTFKIPNHGVEFYFDQKTQKWANRETADANDFHITTISGLKIPIPNFFKTFQTSDTTKYVVKRMNETNGNEPMFLEFAYDEYDALCPKIWFGILENHVYCRSIHCDIYSGEWKHCFLSHTIRDILYVHDYEHMSKRLAKLEYLFDRVRETNSVLDTFLSVCDEVEREELRKKV